MTRFLCRFDRWVDRLTDAACNSLLLATTLVVLYSVLMRYVFSNPPFWSDVVSTFGNVGMILLGLSISVRHRELIAMQALYEKISPRLALFLDATWNLVILVFAAHFTWHGLMAARKIPGFYWELGMMPQSYPMMVVPVAGLLLIIACVGVVAKDIVRLCNPSRVAESEGGLTPHDNQNE